MSDDLSVGVYDPELGVTQSDALVLHRLDLGQESTGQHAVVVVEEGNEIRPGVSDGDVAGNGLAPVSLSDHPHRASFSMSEKSSSHPSATTMRLPVFECLCQHRIDRLPQVGTTPVAGYHHAYSWHAYPLEVIGWILLGDLYR